MHSMGKTVNELHVMLKLHDQTLTTKDPVLHAIQAGKVQKKNNKQKKPQVAARGKIKGKGKESVIAPKTYRFSLPPKKGNPRASVSIFTIELLLLLPNKSWFYDTGCGTSHLSMYVVSNKKAKLNLDSALLWHCRLGHISKKRIEKLQHDGLLNSTNLGALKIRLLLSVKMALKPYTHRSGKGSKESTWTKTHRCIGPFRIVVKQGATTSFTFSDDLVVYGYGPQGHEYPNKVCLYIDAEEYELGDPGEPAYYKAALLDSEFDKWLNAMNVEMQSMKDNKV
ncbi:retrotransposon protein, putative, ty1-copia subclass [Tanacetum coccineum]